MLGKRLGRNGTKVEADTILELIYSLVTPVIKDKTIIHTVFCRFKRPSSHLYRDRGAIQKKKKLRYSPQIFCLHNRSQIPALQRLVLHKFFPQERPTTYAWRTFFEFP